MSVAGGCLPPSPPGWLASPQQSRNHYKGKQTLAMPLQVQEAAKEESAHGGMEDRWMQTGKKYIDVVFYVVLVPLCALRQMRESGWI